MMVSLIPHLEGSGCVESSCACTACTEQIKINAKSMDKCRGIVKYTTVLFSFKETSNLTEMLFRKG